MVFLLNYAILYETYSKGVQSMESSSEQRAGGELDVAGTQPGYNGTRQLPSKQTS